jgi:HK97 family phage major capsid protein
VPYDSVISRSEAAALIPEDASREIIQGLPTQSAALAMFRNVPMSRAQQRMPVIAALPTAYWVNGDTGLKQTSEQTWQNKYLDAEELAVLVPIPEAVLDDADYDVWSEIRPRIQEAIGAALDGAVFFGTNKPSSWPDAVVPAAISASNNYNSGSVGGKDLADETNIVMGLVEADGFVVNGHVADPTLKAALRGLRSATTGDLLFVPGLTSAAPGTLYGETIRYVDNGSWVTADARMVTGDFRQGIIGVRKDLTYKVLDQAVIQDNTGAIVYNLAQQDMVALRVVARFAYQVPNPPSRLKASGGYPFAVLQP